jgi:hypothetical protein
MAASDDGETLGLVFGVSSPTVCRRNRDMTRLLAEHFSIPERKIQLTNDEKDDFLFWSIVILKLETMKNQPSIVLALQQKDLLTKI